MLKRDSTNEYSCLARLVGSMISETEKITDKSSFKEIDDALYVFEGPAYRYWASGGGTDPSASPAWVQERQRLTKLWHDKCDYFPHEIDCPHIKLGKRKIRSCITTIIGLVIVVVSTLLIYIISDSLG